MTQFEYDVEDALLFMKSHNRFDSWGDEARRELIRFYFAHGMGAIIRQADHKIIAAGFAHTCNYRKTDQYADYWRTSTEGNSIYIVDIVADHPRAIPILWSMMTNKFGEKKFVIGKNRGKVVKWPYRTYTKKMEFLDKHYNLN